ncbi:GATA zinc finger domain-containing protein 4-like [Oppia nitens]|uniref:GATA zinc finger domain-containing protein 4-like n=1 Tax=Oppia nitens TaxID=1686743 RepID=UPI0023DC1610|nr:GATA zinc finger domain-containing protein 4-like [Oppia nitens]
MSKIIQLPLFNLILAIILIESENFVKCNNTNINNTDYNSNNSGINVNNSGNISNQSAINININSSLSNIQTNSNNISNNKIKLFDLPPISELTSKMTGRWYKIYATSSNMFINLDIENVFGSNPPELKLALSNEINGKIVRGYTILDQLNGMDVTYDEGSRVNYNIMDYDFERYLVMRNTKSKNVELTVYSRFNDQSPEKARLLNNIYRKLDRLGLKINLKPVNNKKPKNRRLG